MVVPYPQAHYCENEIRGETSLSQVPPHPSLEITWAVCLIGRRIVLMNNNMMWGKSTLSAKRTTAVWHSP